MLQREPGLPQCVYPYEEVGFVRRGNGQWGGVEAGHGPGTFVTFGTFGTFQRACETCRETFHHLIDDLLSHAVDEMGELFPDKGFEVIALPLDDPRKILSCQRLKGLVRGRFVDRLAGTFGTF